MPLRADLQRMEQELAAFEEKHGVNIAVRTPGQGEDQEAAAAQQQQQDEAEFQQQQQHRGGRHSSNVVEVEEPTPTSARPSPRIPASIVRGRK